MSNRSLFTPEEKQFLLDEVNENKTLLENKKNDLKTNLRKNRQWEEIAERFNRRYSKCVSAKSLNQLYRKMKVVARKELSDQKNQLRATGGGPYEASVSSLSQQIADLDDTLTFSLENEFDDDSENASNDTSANIEVNRKSEGKAFNKRDHYVKTEHLKRMEVLELQAEVFRKQIEVCKEQKEAARVQKEYYIRLQASHPGPSNPSANNGKFIHFTLLLYLSTVTLKV